MRCGCTPINETSVSRVKSLLASTWSACCSAKHIAWNLRAAAPARQLLAVRVDQDLAPAQATDRPRHQALRKGPSGHDSRDVVRRRQAQRPPENAQVHHQRLRPQPGHALEHEAVDRIRVVPVELGVARHCAGNHVH